MLINNQLSAGHARALIAVDNPLALALKIVAGGLSVRQAEQMAQEASDRPLETKSLHQPALKDVDTTALEKLISDHLGMKVTINHSGGGGAMNVRYRDLEQLDELCRRLKGG
jgi:ParB family transcriptional regulator, chromosome partitioning protein